MFWNVYSELCSSYKKKPSAVAEEIGLSNSITTKWKKGALPKGEILLKLADYFNCSIDYLVYGKEKNISSDLSEDKQRLLDMYDLLTEREQGEILGELKALTRDRAEAKNAEIA